MTVIRRLLSKNALLFEIAIYILIIISAQVLSVLHIYNLWFDVTRYFSINILGILMILATIGKLDQSNLDGLSILIFIFYRSEVISSEYPTFLQNIVLAVNIISSLVLLILLIVNKHKPLGKITLRQIALFFAGLLLGICIAVIKILANNQNLIKLALDNPILIISSLQFSLIIACEEIFFRGIIWGYLREKKVNEHAIVFITSFLWTTIHITAYGNIPELINFFILGIIFGYLTKMTKTINTSIGAHTGYSVFLVMQSIYFS